MKWLAPIVSGARDGFVKPVWSPLILTEVNRLLTWLWLRKNGGDQREASWRRCSAASKIWFSIVTRVFRVVDDHPPHEQTWSEEPADAWDVPIWTAAIRARRQFPGVPVFIVTENLKDGPPRDEGGLQVFRSVGFIHPNDFPAVLSVWADISATAERQRKGGGPPAAPASELAEDTSLPADTEELLRIMSALTDKPPEGW